jgi:hypothetical protein
MLMEAAILATVVLASGPSSGLALPLKRDIPAKFSTVICIDEPKARTFINDYIVPNANGTDAQLDSFFQGLAATGCFQDGGPLEIEEVLVRKPVVQGQTLGHILYRAKRPSGETLFGIVDEIANNRYPRTPFEEWISLQTEDGVLTANRGEGRTYACRSPQAARAAVASLSRSKQSRVRGNRLRVAKTNALRAGGCVEAQGRFQIRTVHNSVAVFFNNDAESMEDWTALTAVNGRGQVVGLLHNASLF